MVRALVDHRVVLPEDLFVVFMILVYRFGQFGDLVMQRGAQVTHVTGEVLLVLVTVSLKFSSEL